VNVPKLKEQFPNTIFLEDNCEGFTGKYNNLFSGTKSLASSISFFGNKTLTSGEGGAFITDDEDIFNFINVTKNQGQSDFKFIHSQLGYNYRMTNIQAAILLGQINDYEVIKKKKKIIFDEYKKNLGGIKEIEFQKIDKDTEHSEWMFGVRFVNFTMEDKNKLELYLFESGVDTRPMFYDINKHNHLKEIPSQNKNSQILQSQCLILPSFPTLTKSQISYICSKIKNYLKNI
jgi:perosamine synthetase